MATVKKNVLQIFKKLHRTRLKVFDQDERALKAAREKINDEFRKNKLVADTASINELVKFASDVELEMRKTIIQAKEIEPGKYEARITKDIVKLDNIEFDIAKCPDHDSTRKPSPCPPKENST